MRMAAFLPLSWLIILCVLLSLLLSMHMIIMVESLAQAHSPQTILCNPAMCGRPDVSRSAVCDPDLLLAKEDKDMLEYFFSVVTKARIALLIINKMDSSYTSQFRSRNRI